MQGEKRRPDSADHHANGVCAVHILYGEPEDREDGTRYNGDVGAPESPGGAGNDWEGNMMEDTDCAVKCDDEGDDEEGESDYAEGFAPCKTLLVLNNV